MTTIAEGFKIDGAHLAQTLHELREQLGSLEEGVVLDFSSVPGLDTAGLQELEKLAGAAEKKVVKITLCGVNVAIYKVLKLARLTSRFTFAD